MTNDSSMLSTAKSATLLLEEWAAAIDADLSVLLLQHSSIRNLDHERDRNSGVFFAGANYAFNALSLEGRRLQSKLLGELKPFAAMARALLWRAPEGRREELDEAEKEILEVVEQTHCVWHRSPGEALEACQKQVRDLFEAIEALHDPDPDAVLFVPDTNALLYNTAIASWRLPGIEQATLMLVPTVLGELDELKVSHKNPDVRAKSETLIRQLKEFRRRGRLTSGVTVVTGSLSIRALATEPNLDQTLPWLRAHSNDDRILGSMIEIMRLHPRARIALVTRDINLQNKAEMARISYVEPPEAETGSVHAG
jgi:hypothetical protein